MHKILFFIFTLSSLFSFDSFAQKEEKSKKEKPAQIASKSLIFSKQKSAWQVGLFGGTSILMGDVKPNFFSGNKPALPGHNFGLFINKSWTYLFSTRLRYSTMVMFTNDAVASTLTTNQLSYLEQRSSGLNGYSAGDLFFHNSRTQAHDLTLDLVFSIGNVNFHKERSIMVFKVFPSVGMMMYQTFHDHLDANGDAYDYGSLDNLNDLGSSKRSDVLKALSNMRDGKYETRAEEHSVDDENKFLNYTPEFVFGLGAGVSFRLTKFMTLDIETKQMLSTDDLIDGMQWQEPDGQNTISGNLTRGFDSYNQTTLGLSFSIMGKNTAESKNMDNPFAGADAFSKKDAITSEKEQAKEDSVIAEMDSKVKDLEQQVNSLELLIKMLGQAKQNEEKPNQTDDLSKEEQQAALEKERKRLQEEADSLNELQNNSSTKEKNEGNLNDLDNKEYKLRNGNDIFVAKLEGEINAEYYLIIGSFKVKSNANKDERKWSNKGINTVTMTDVKSGLYRLVVDFTNDHSEALDMLDEYRAKLNKDIWLIKAK